MRKLLIAALVSLLVLPAAGSQAAPTRQAGVDLYRFSITSFIDHSGAGAPMLYFGAGLSLELGHDVAFAGRGPCRRVEVRGRMRWSCRASAKGVNVLPTGYYMDPLLQTAHIGFESGRYEHTADWTGKGEPQLVYFGSGSNAIVHAFNNATVTGRLFGRRFSTKRDKAMGFLGELAWASVDFGDLEFDLDDDAERVQVRALFPAGR